MYCVEMSKCIIIGRLFACAVKHVFVIQGLFQVATAGMFAGRQVHIHTIKYGMKGTMG